MNNIMLALSAIVIIFLFLSLGVFVGRKFGHWQLKRDSRKQLVVVQVAEAAVFALLGLMVAFSFSGAYERFEARKIYIIDEANAIDTAFMRLDLLAPDTRPALRQSFREYLDTRLAAYKHLPDFESSSVEYAKSLRLKQQIWDQTIAACHVTDSQVATQLVIESVNTMFEIANTRYAIKNIHPPLAVFCMLLGLAFLSAFLAGYCTAKDKVKQLIYVLAYLVIITLIIYIILDLEFPRVGMIHVNSFDSILVDIEKNIDSNPGSFS